jgi:dienelactone hydrolase
MPLRTVSRLFVAGFFLSPLLVAQAPAADSPANAGRKQLTEYLDHFAADETAARRKVVDGITTRAQAEARQVAVRKKLIGLLGGLPEKTPLNARSLGVMQAKGFRIERIMFDSQPGFPVTALLYLPDPKPGSGKLPAIVVAPGHGPTGKTSDYAFSSVFAMNGFAVLDYDPIGQGERLQYPDPQKPGATLAKGPTGEHGEAGLQPTLVGDAVARYFAWDGMRAVDYLQSRAEIDPERIGAFGCSGGGMMTALLAAVDTRIKATGTACYITSFDTLLPSIGPQDAEQSIPGFIAAGLDFPDWVELAAPRPYAIIATTEDMFPFEGAQKTEAEARRFYQLFGADADLEFLTGPGHHGNIRPIMPRILTFFLKHLQPGADAANPVLPPPPAPGASPFAPPPLPKETFLDTSTGQVATSFPNAETVHSLNLKRFEAMPTRKALTGEVLRAAVRRVTKTSVDRGTAKREIPGQGTVVLFKRVTLHPAQGIELQALFSGRTHGIHPAVLLLSEAVSAPYDSAEYKQMVAETQRLGQAGNIVLAVSPQPSPPGTEETKAPILGVFYLSELRAELVGKTLMGMRIDDTICALNFLAAHAGVDAKRITAEASGHLGLVLLHAAVLDQRLSHITIDHSLSSFRTLVEAPMPIGAPEDILPGVLQQYDLPDLVTALGSRVTVNDPLNGTDDLSGHP